MSPAVRWAMILVLLASLGDDAARASDEAGFKDLKSLYDKLSRNQDENATRERRKLLLQSFDFLDQKACRTFLRKAYGEENLPDPRIAAVQVLAGSGDPKDLEFLLGAFRKEKALGPLIALGEGLGYTAPEHAAAVAAWIGAQLPRQKGEVLRSLLEGLGELGEGAAYAPLNALGEKLAPAERFERLVALGACGRAAAVPALAHAAESSDADLRLAATTGLGRTGAPEAVSPLRARLADADWRVVEEAALALGARKDADSVAALADALPAASLRVKESIRSALKQITGTDFGHDADAWKSGKQGAAAPTPPRFFGLAAPSDRVVALLDLSRSMDWKGRLDRARTGVAAWLETLPTGATFGVVGVARTPVPSAERMESGPAARLEAVEWVRKQLTGSGGFDLREALLYVLRNRQQADTLVLATDSAPWGESNDDTPLEVLQEFRRENRIRRLRVFVAFVAPGGRYEESETFPEEYADRKDLLKLLAESTGGTFIAIE